MDTRGISVAVIGAGPTGMAALKYLRAEGFEVTAFERRADVGGLWMFSDNPKFSSANASTTFQLSKYFSCMSDFPFPKDYPVHVDAPLLSTYYKSYARHFNLYENIEFNVSVKAITRDDAENKWLVHLDCDTGPRKFDKVVLATGTETEAKLPIIEGLDLFEGTFIHGQAFKGPEPFRGKTVIVIGQGNTAGDAAVDLSDHCSNVFFSHRRGVKIAPRLSKNGPVDALVTWKISRATYFLSYYAPKLYSALVDSVFRKTIREAWGEQDPEWGFEPSPSTANGLSVCMINDRIIPQIRAGKIRPVPGIKRIIGSKSVELTNGKVLEDIDAIIACTGYYPDWSLTPDIPITVVDERVAPLPDLFHGVFPTRYADSMACLQYISINENAATYRELIAMAVSQIWSGKSALPAEEVMRTQIVKHQRWHAKRLARSVAPWYGEGQPYPWMKFMHGAAGTGLYENLGWGRSGWKFWWSDPKFYRTVAWGIMSPHILRLFETGKRPVWQGAREAIVAVNEQFQSDFGKQGTKRSQTKSPVK